MEHQAILLEAQFFPCLQYLSKFLLYPRVIIEQHEHYSKGSYRNRCHIAGPNGLLRLSIPLKKGKNAQLPIKNTRIAYEESWQKEHWATIQTAYGNAPFFEHYADEIKSLFEKKEQFLFDYNLLILETILSVIQIESNFELSVSYQKEIPENILDFRNGISPKSKSVQPDNNFEAAKYPQVFEEKSGFLPNLSILDLLFCAGPQASFILENCLIK